MQSKQIAAIQVPGIDPQATTPNKNGTGTDSDYLKQLKALVDEKVEKNMSGYGIEYAYIRDRFCLQARRLLKKAGKTTLEELNYCFPEYKKDNSAFLQSIQEKEESSGNESPQSHSEPTRPPTRQQAEERLNNSLEPQDDSDEIKLSKAKWEWIEKANHSLGGRLFFGSIVTPQFMELDLKLGISDSPHRRRLLDLLSLHCDNSTGITTGFSVAHLAEKLQCGKDKVRGAIKWLVEREVLEYSENSKYPRHYTEKVSFKLPFVVEADQTKYHAYRIAKKTGIHYRELWERREEFGCPVKCGGETEAEGEGVRPPSSS